ncbi:MAG TPA: glycosyltransferase family 2 protein [Dinghuibacter sp.]|uniref:glycosyltransferase family 2 protein n=1 Tax=Dinghuibacter sp. TaxID=2024697 RepID=UPI002C5951E4|nr:glycosyltransferase family 2 protein [Dinghuibacter sp.]HTJ14061.1 glycosyltransferase family 2 protein [Dinghuibacter sp.]
MPEVSVILPVYNVAGYIGRCAQSLLEQTFTDFELIVVDDASNDDSIGVLERSLGGRLPYTLITHAVNRGLSAARNTGIDASRGRYLYFPDSDDFLEPGLLSYAWEQAEAGADVVVFGLRSVPGNDDIPGLEGVRSGKEALRAVLEGRCKTYICTQLFRKTLFDHIRFPEGYIYEDRFTTPYLFEAASQVAFVRRVFYNYRQRPGSITKTFHPEMAKNVARIGAMETDLLGAFPEWKTSIGWFTYRNIYSMVLVALIRGDTYDAIRPVWKECRRHVRWSGLWAWFSEERRPAVALGIFNISPRLFWTCCKNYYRSRHQL